MLRLVTPRGEPMKLNRLIAASIVGFSMLSASTSAFACDHDHDSGGSSWSWFGWCHHDHDHDGGGKGRRHAKGDERALDADTASCLLHRLLLSRSAVVCRGRSGESNRFDSGPKKIPPYATTPLLPRWTRTMSTNSRATGRSGSARRLTSSSTARAATAGHPVSIAV